MSIIASMIASDDDPRGIKARLKAAGKTQKDLADFMRVDYNAVFRIVSGGRKKLTADEERAIEDFFAGVSGTQNGRRQAPYYAMPAANLAEVPLFGFAGAAPNGPIHLNHEPAAEYVPRHPAQGRAAEAFAVRVWGESMSPRYEPGEIAYCVRGQHPARNQDVVIEMKSGDAYLKTYLGMRDGQILTRQLNPMTDEGETQSWPMSDVKAMHAVVGRG